MLTTDLIWTLVGFVLTLLVFTFLIGDNPLFRLTAYLFVGVMAGYVASVVIYQVLIPRLARPLMEGSPEERLLALVPLVLAALMLTKLSPRLSHLGAIPMAYLVGVGAAVTVGGAALGTIIPQTLATIQSFGSAEGANLGGIAEAAIFLLGTASTLIYFQFQAHTRPGQPPERSRPIRLIARIGEVFIAVTLGAVFAGVYSAAVTALIDRLDFILTVITTIF
ncbi:MAG: hypothetical protein HPY76_10470 [Anaerolineae bacterium]|nr:hypothetical protein [Anaerolineae bacterium]